MGEKLIETEPDAYLTQEEKDKKINKVDPESPVMTHKDRTRPTGGSSPLGKTER